MPFRHPNYSLSDIQFMLQNDEGQNMNNGAPPPHALGLHGSATDHAMLNRVHSGQAYTTSRFVNFGEMCLAIQEALLSPDGQGLLGNLDNGAATAGADITVAS